MADVKKGTRVRIKNDITDGMKPLYKNQEDFIKQLNKMKNKEVIVKTIRRNRFYEAEYIFYNYEQFVFPRNAFDLIEDEDKTMNKLRRWLRMLFVKLFYSRL